MQFVERIDGMAKDFLEAKENCDTKGMTMIAMQAGRLIQKEGRSDGTASIFVDHCHAIFLQGIFWLIERNYAGALEAFQLWCSIAAGYAKSLGAGGYGVLNAWNYCIERERRHGACEQLSWVVAASDGSAWKCSFLPDLIRMAISWSSGS